MIESSDYNRQLELQNEQLQKKLAEAQAFHAWRDQRHATKLDFTYAYVIFRRKSKESYLVCITRHQAKYIIQFPFKNNEDNRCRINKHAEHMRRDLNVWTEDMSLIDSVYINVIAHHNDSRFISSKSRRVILYDKMLTT